MSDVRCVQAANAILGEGPSWDAASGALYWVDIQRPAIFRFEEGRGQTGAWVLPRPVGCAVAAETGDILLADNRGFARLDLTSGDLKPIKEGAVEMGKTRFNDGKVDRAGRFWAGTIDDRDYEPVGVLYCLDNDGNISSKADGFRCSNGLGWSPDDRKMYFVDSMIRTVWVYDFDLASGDLGERRVFALLADDDGVPDGLTVDAEGYVWVAIWDGWRVIRYAPDGSIDREIDFPVARPTSCMFGGQDFSTLYVTSASINLSPDMLTRGPLAGALFAVDAGVKGAAETRARIAL